MNKGAAVGIIAVMVTAMLLASISTISANEELYGDANGDGKIDMRDVTYVGLIILGKKPANELADANQDGKINVGDITYIELIILGKIPTGTLVIAVQSLRITDSKYSTEPVEKTGGLDAQSYNAEMYVFPLVYDALVELGENLEIIPGLAESWDISSDGEVYTFYLRKGVKFSDGTPFTAEAVKFSMERMKQICPSGSNTMDDFTRITVVDPYTVKIYYDEPYYPIIREFAFVRPQRIMSPSAVEPYGDPEGMFIKPVGTGPFKFQEYVKDQEYVLVRNGNYWKEGRPKVATIVFKLIPDGATRIMALRAGEVDLLGGKYSAIYPTSVADLIRNPDIRVLAKEGDGVTFIIPNYAREPYGDVRVRQAINHAIDEEAIVPLHAGICRPAKENFFAPNIPYYRESYEKGIIKGYPYDPEKAKELLAEAGWEDTNGDGIVDKGGKPFEAKLVIPSVPSPGVTLLPSLIPLAEVIQSQLKDVGIKVNIECLERGAWYDVIGKTYDYDMYIRGVWGAYYDPPTTLKALWYTGARLKYSDPEFDELVDEVLVTTDETERQEIYDEIFKHMDEKSLVPPLYRTERLYAFRTCVKGFEIPPTGYSALGMEDVEVEK